MIYEKQRHYAKYWCSVSLVICQSNPQKLKSGAPQFCIHYILDLQRLQFVLSYMYLVFTILQCNSRTTVV